MLGGTIIFSCSGNHNSKPSGGSGFSYEEVKQKMQDEGWSKEQIEFLQNDNDQLASLYSTKKDCFDELKSFSVAELKAFAPNWECFSHSAATKETVSILKEFPLTKIIPFKKEELENLLKCNNETLSELSAWPADKLKAIRDNSKIQVLSGSNFSFKNFKALKDYNLKKTELIFSKLDSTMQTSMSFDPLIISELGTWDDDKFEAFTDDNTLIFGNISKLENLKEFKNWDASKLKIIRKNQCLSKGSVELLKSLKNWDCDHLQIVADQGFSKWNDSHFSSSGLYKYGEKLDILKNKSVTAIKGALQAYKLLGIYSDGVLFTIWIENKDTTYFNGL